MVHQQIKYSLHCFAGAGGGVLGDWINGITAVAGIEIEEDPRNVLLQRFPGMVAWDDVRTFTEDNPDCREAFAILRAVRSQLVIAGGFPCQDISAAGKGAGIRGQRSGLFFEMARVIREIQPAAVYLENSPQLIQRGIECLLWELASMGYDACWGVLGAGQVGARHRRDRIWIAGRLADTELARLEKRRKNSRKQKNARFGSSGPLSNPDCKRR